jgi:transposase
MTLANKRDARSLDHQTLEEMRRLAVSRVLAGEQQAAVARSLQVSRTTVVRWMMSYRAEGEDGLAAKKATGRPPELSPRQQDQLRKMILGKTPAQLGFGMALWTIPLVRLAIEKRFGVALHETTVSRMLGRLGLTPQKPTRRAFQRDDEECRRWATVEFPVLVRAAARKQATLLFLDESGVHEDGPIGTTWGQRGVRPVVRVSGSRRRLNVISAISPRGRLWFRCFKGTLTASRFIEFLEALLHDVRGFIVLVVDRHPAHVAAATRRWLLEHGNRIAVHHLPAYAPDLNPDEHVWGYLKGMFRRNPLQEAQHFDIAVVGAMEKIQEDRALVRKFFEHPEVAYVRDALNW